MEKSWRCQPHDVIDANLDHTTGANWTDNHAAVASSTLVISAQLSDHNCHLTTTSRISVIYCISAYPAGRAGEWRNASSSQCICNEPTNISRPQQRDPLTLQSVLTRSGHRHRLHGVEGDSLTLVSPASAAWLCSVARTSAHKHTARVLWCRAPLLSASLLCLCPASLAQQSCQWSPCRTRHCGSGASR